MKKVTIIYIMYYLSGVICGSVPVFTYKYIVLPWCDAGCHQNHRQVSRLLSGYHASRVHQYLRKYLRFYGNRVKCIYMHYNDYMKMYIKTIVQLTTYLTISQFCY